MGFLQEISESILHLAFPKLCMSCSGAEPMRGQLFCLDCSVDLPYTAFFTTRGNEMENRLTGRLPFVYGTSLFYFYKEGKVQEFVHKLKYNRKAQVGEQLGREFGQAWQKSPMLEKPDLLIPIPLHPKREFKRGYNQSFMFAKGIAVVLDIPIFTKALKKTIHTESQTHKSREERIENIKESFAIGGNPNLAGKHILIVDDVLTTGATLEVFSKTLLAYEPNCRLSVGTIALAMAM